MSTNSAPSQLPHAWAPDALFAKAQKYAEEMLKTTKDDWKHGLWSSLTLELLGRAALANINPALLADPKDWNHLLFALGYQPKASKFSPKSIDVSSVFSRLKDLLKDFTPELEGFSVLHMQRRNEELHSGSSPFDGYAISGWLPSFYEASKVLLVSMQRDLSTLLGSDEAAAAEAMIAAAKDEQAKAVKKSVAAHQTVWDSKDQNEQNSLMNKANVWASRQDGHRVKCPACNCDALVFGIAIAPATQSIDADQITETQQFLPSKFECIACGLKMSGLSHLSACGLGAPFKATYVYDAADYYRSDDDYAEYEPDFNEP